MLKAFFDDSGSHAAGKVYVVAGYIAPVGAWIDFEEEWSSALTRHGLNYIKAEQAHRRSKEFSGRSRQAVEHILQDVSGMIAQHVLYEVSIQVPRGEFDQIMADVGVSERQKYNSPYLLCYRELLALLRGLIPFLVVEERPNIDVVFDDQALVKGIVQAAAREPLAVGSVISSTSFADDRTLSPLQAADMIAWSLHRAYTVGHVPPGTQRLMTLPALRLRVDAKRMREFATGLKVSIGFDPTTQKGVGKAQNGPRRPN